MAPSPTGAPPLVQAWGEEWFHPHPRPAWPGVASTAAAMQLFALHRWSTFLLAHEVSSCMHTIAREKRSEEHTSELQSQSNLVCRLLLEKKTQQQLTHSSDTR